MVPLTKLASLFLFFSLLVNGVRAQSTTDSSGIVDTVTVKAVAFDTAKQIPVTHKIVRAVPDTAVVYHTDSVRFSATKPLVWNDLPTGWISLLKAQSFFNFSGKAVHIRAENYEPVSFDGLFYFLLGLLFYFAIIKLLFGKYLGNLLTLFFRASMRQQQLREQVLQSPFPSLLLNILFLFSGGLYGAFIMRFFLYENPDPFWRHFLYCAGGLAALYLLKFLILKITGWIFNIGRAVETYLFVVFLTNKIIGVFLLPFLLIVSFSSPGITEIALTTSYVMIGIFYIYRFIASYRTLHKEIKISGLHFFLYLCAFEMAPLLLIYKVLVTYLEKA